MRCLKITNPWLEREQRILITFRGNFGRTGRIQKYLADLLPFRNLAKAPKCQKGSGWDVCMFYLQWIGWFYNGKCRLTYKSRGSWPQLSSRIHPIVCLWGVLFHPRWLVIGRNSEPTQQCHNVSYTATLRIKSCKFDFQKKTKASWMGDNLLHILIWIPSWEQLLNHSQAGSHFRKCPSNPSRDLAPEGWRRAIVT